MKLKWLNKEMVLVRRHTQEEKIGSIFLPDEFISGESGALSKNRFCDVLATPEDSHIKEGTVVAVHELSSKSIEIGPDEYAHLAPIELVTGALTSEGFECFQNYILVKADPSEEKIGAIFIPDESRKPSQYGTVVGIGPDCKYLEVGARIMFQLFGGLALDVNGEELLVMRELPVDNNYADDVLGLIE